MSYWIYENWTAEHKAVIHCGDCGHCKEGKGCHRNVCGDANGKWHGPFDTLRAAESTAQITSRPVRYHKCILQ